MIVRFLNFELWIHLPYIHPMHWNFGIGSGCHEGCCILELGFGGVTYLRNGCRCGKSWYNFVLPKPWPTSQ